MTRVALGKGDVTGPAQLPAYATRRCKRSALQGADAFEPRPLQRRTGSQIGWPLACEELIVKIDPSGPMTSNKS